jgi:hypothetical protein
MTFTIEVAETHPPANGKKLATVTTKTGEKFGIRPDKLGTLRELLAAGIHSGAVTFAAADLRTAIAMLRALWRDVTREGR